MDNIECTNCGNDDFYLREGSYFCCRCHFISEEHGRETGLDEAALSHFGSASTLKTQALSDGSSSRRRRGRGGVSHVVFTTIDVFTFIVKGWVDEAIELGAQPSLRQLVFTIWGRYLQTVGVAFTPPGVDPRVTTFRDVQVKLFGRKKVFTQSDIKNHKSKRMKPVKSELELVDPLDDSREAKRYRSRKRKEFLKAVSDQSRNESDADGDSEFSFGSSFTSSFNRGVSMDSSSLASMSSFDLSTDSEDGGDSDEDERQARVLSNCTLHLQNKTTLNWKKTKDLRHDVTLPTAFSCFALGVLCNEGNVFTVADLVYWVETGAISYRTATRHIPRALQLRGRDDIRRFEPLTELTHDFLRERLFTLACILNLGEVNFNAHGTLKHVLKRYLREFSLPARLKRCIFRALSEGGRELLELNQTFPMSAPVKALDVFVCADVRALGLILWALKHLYVMDGLSESALSRHRRPGAFLVAKWLRLSRARLLLAVRHAHVLHRKFGHLCPEVELSDEAALAEARHDSDEICLRKVNMRKARRDSKQAAAVKKKFLSELTRLDVNDDHRDGDEDHGKDPFYLSASLCPLHDFAVDGVTSLRAFEKELVAELLAMHNLMPFMQVAEEGAEEVALEAEFRLGFISGRNSPAEQEDHSVTYSDQMHNTEEASVNLKRTYWQLKPFAYNMVMPWHFRRSWVQEEILRNLPDEFGWILEYFAAHSGISVGRLYTQLLLVEETILKADKGYFGHLEHSHRLKKCSNRRASKST